jgi:hypothetical protein
MLGLLHDIVGEILAVCFSVHSSENERQSCLTLRASAWLTLSPSPCCRQDDLDVLLLGLSESSPLAIVAWKNQA